MAVSPQQKFDCAVQVIKSLPKNGSFQPSNEMMLRFYSFYKQVVEGPCHLPQPGFWDVIGKAKWKAWHDLGDMPKETAMLNYVDDLKQIIETMPQTQDVADFMSTLGDFYEMVDEKTPFCNPGKTEPLLTEESVKQDDTTNGSDKPTNGPVIQDNEYTVSNSSLNHSAVIEDHLKSNALLNGDVSADVAEDKETQKTYNGLFTEDTSDKQSDVKLITSDSDTESEDFCDTSDEPIQSHQLVGKALLTEDEVEASTPVGNKSGNRVRFSDTATIHLPSGQFSPIKLPIDQMQNSHGLEILTAARAEQSRAILSDSLFVNTSSHETADTSLSSQLDFSMDSVDLSRSCCEVGRVRGGRRMPDNRGSGLTSGSKTGVSRGRRGLFSGEEVDGNFDWTEHDRDVNKQISVTLHRLQQDMNNVYSRLGTVESTLRKKKREGEWWLFGQLSTKTVIFIVAWPFIAHFIMNLIFRRNRNVHR